MSVVTVLCVGIFDGGVACSTAGERIERAVKNKVEVDHFVLAQWVRLTANAVSCFSLGIEGVNKPAYLANGAETSRPTGMLYLAELKLLQRSCKADYW